MVFTFLELVGNWTDFLKPGKNICYDLSLESGSALNAENTCTIVLLRLFDVTFGLLGSIIIIYYYRISFHNFSCYLITDTSTKFVKGNDFVTNPLLDFHICMCMWVHWRITFQLKGCIDFDVVLAALAVGYWHIITATRLSALRLSNFDFGLYLDGWPWWYVNFCW